MILTSGSYDHILDQILSYLDWNSLKCLLCVEAVWQTSLTQLWQSDRFTRRVENHWKQFVPSQREIRWDKEASASHIDNSTIVCGFSDGGLVKYCRHTYQRSFYKIAHPGFPVTAVGFDKQYVVSGSKDKLVKFWDFHSGDFRGETFHQGIVERPIVVGAK